MPTSENHLMLITKTPSATMFAEDRTHQRIRDRYLKAVSGRRSDETAPGCSVADRNLSETNDHRRDNVRACSLFVTGSPNRSRIGEKIVLPLRRCFWVGRCADRSMSFPEVSTVSRQHACIYHRGNSVVIRDWGSRNGTFVNGMRVGSATLKSGDRISIGPVELKLLVHDDPEYAFLNTLLELATLDHLTGLSNRRAFDNNFEKEVDRARRYDRSLSMLVFDIDKFKRINDKMGHPFADQIIQDFARLLLQSCRRQDSVARIGGDEFAMICPETSFAKAAELAARMVTRTRLLGITCSIGVAELQHSMPGELYRTADRALYAAKRRGGDQHAG